MSKKGHLLIVDVSALAFRSHFGFINRPLSRADGMATSALYGTANTLVSVIAKTNPTHIVCARDTGKKTFRNEIYPEYKANRPPCPPELAPQLALMGELCESFSASPVMKDGFEADDVIGTYALRGHEAGLEVTILSGDKDFMQFIRPGIKMLTQGKSGEYADVNEDAVFAKMGVYPNQIVDYLALMGDAADNIPGAPGVGKVTAAKLLAEYKTLDVLLEKAPEMKKSKLRENIVNNHDLIALSKKLVIIDRNIEGLPSLDDCAFSGYDLKKLKPFLEEMEFPKILSRVESGSQEKVVEKTFLSNKSQFKIIEDKEKFAQLIELLAGSLDVWIYPHIEEGVLLGLSLSRKPNQAVYLPMNGTRLISYGVSNPIECLNELFKDYKGKVHGYDLKEWLHILSKTSLELEVGVDSYLLLTVSSPNKSTQDLSKLSYELDKYKLASLEKRGNKTPTFMEQNAQVQCNYCCDRVVTGMRLESVFAEDIKTNGLEPVVELEMNLLPVIVDMEAKGINIDVDKLKAYSIEAGDELDKLDISIYAEAGEEFNIRSPKQLGEILFDKMKVQDIVGLKKVKKTKTGYSTDNTILGKLKELPIAQHLMRHRHLSKLKSGYLDSLPKEVSSVSQRIHTHYLQNGTATGRLSSHQPNLQNIPMRSDDGARIREAFVPSNENYVLISADYSQIELRVLAYFSKDEVLLETFRKDEDVHASTAAKVYGLELDQVSKTQRSSAKAVNFGLLYGMGPKHLSEDTGMTFSESQKFIKDYFATFPSIQNFLTKQVEHAREVGFAETLAGRKRALPGLESSNGMVRNAAENMALNTPIQGSAADIIKWAMIRLQKRIKNENLDLRMLLQVHDELIFECPKEKQEEMIQIIKEEMESNKDLPADFLVPLKVQADSGKNWREIH